MAYSPRVHKEPDTTQRLSTGYKININEFN